MGVLPNKLWAGGCAAALVAAGVAVVGYLLVRGVLDIPIIGARRGGRVVQPTMFGYAAVAATGALVATGLAHILLLTTPRPRSFFNWIIALATIVAVLLPLALNQPLEARLATAAVNLAIGITIGVLVSMSVEASIRPLPPPGNSPGGYPPAGYTRPL
jgi:hypothetical protein